MRKRKHSESTLQQQNTKYRSNYTTISIVTDQSTQTCAEFNGSDVIKITNEAILLENSVHIYLFHSIHQIMFICLEFIAVSFILNCVHHNQLCTVGFTHYPNYLITSMHWEYEPIQIQRYSTAQFSPLTCNSWNMENIVLRHYNLNQSKLTLENAAQTSQKSILISSQCTNMVPILHFTVLNFPTFEMCYFSTTTEFNISKKVIISQFFTIQFVKPKMATMDKITTGNFDDKIQFVETRSPVYLAKNSNSVHKIQTHNFDERILRSLAFHKKKMSDMKEFKTTLKYLFHPKLRKKFLKNIFHLTYYQIYDSLHVVDEFITSDSLIQEYQVSFTQPVLRLVNMHTDLFTNSTVTISWVRLKTAVPFLILNGSRIRKHQRAPQTIKQTAVPQQNRQSFEIQHIAEQDSIALEVLQPLYMGQDNFLIKTCKNERNPLKNPKLCMKIQKGIMKARRTSTRSLNKNVHYITSKKECNTRRLCWTTETPKHRLDVLEITVSQTPPSLYIDVYGMYSKANRCKSLEISRSGDAVHYQELVTTTNCSTQTCRLNKESQETNSSSHSSSYSYSSSSIDPCLDGESTRSSSQQSTLSESSRSVSTTATVSIETSVQYTNTAFSTSSYSTETTGTGDQSSSSGRDGSTTRDLLPTSHGDNDSSTESIESNESCLGSGQSGITQSTQSQRKQNNRSHKRKREITTTPIKSMSVQTLRSSTRMQESNEFSYIPIANGLNQSTELLSSQNSNNVVYVEIDLTSKSSEILQSLSPNPTITTTTTTTSNNKKNRLSADCKLDQLAQYSTSISVYPIGQCCPIKKR